MLTLVDQEPKDRFRVTLFALTAPPSPMFYRDFPRRSDALSWQRWARETLPCNTKFKSISGE